MRERFDRWYRRLRVLFRKGEVEREMDEEMRFHMEMEAAELVRTRGLSPEEAWRQARIAFGGVERFKEEGREARGVRWLEDLSADLRYAVRMLRKRPGLASVIVVTLALGIGTSVMIYSAGRALIFEAIPFPDPDRLVTVEFHGERGRWLSPTHRGFQVLESTATPTISLAAYTNEDRFVGDGTRTFQLRASRVTGFFFSALGIEPLLGRTLTPGDDAPGNGQVAVITSRLWRNRFGEAPEIIGKPIRIDGQVHTIVGVIPTGSQYPAGIELWTPLGPPVADAASPYMIVLGRLKPGATREEVQVALATIQHGLDQGRSVEERTSRLLVQPLSGRPSGRNLVPFFLLQGAVLALLLIATTNAAGLMLMRALERRQEIAVRASLGAGRGRILRQFLVESMLLAGISAILALAVAHLGISAIRAAVPAAFSARMLGWERFGLNGHALVFALGLAVLTGILIGIVPARRALRGDLGPHLRDGTPTATAGRQGSRAIRFFLSGEVAVALTLLLTAGLFTRSLIALLDSDPGFEADGVLTVQWALPPERYEGRDAIVRFQDPLLERLEGVPGVVSAGLISNLPMSRTGWTRRYRLHGGDHDTTSRAANWRPITPGYLRTLGIPLMRGRDFLGTDIAGAPRVAIVTEALVKRDWPDGASPLGQQLTVGGETWTVVGVTEDVHDFGVDRRAGPTIYVPHAQAPITAGFLAVRTAGDPAALAPRIRQEIWGLDPDIAIGEVRTMPRLVRDFYADDRILAQMMAAFASIALLITVVSLFTLVAHSVVRRRREIGIRLALGARPRQILADAMSQGLIWVAVGGLVGLVLSVGLARVLAAMLYGIRPLDPTVFLFVPGGLLAVAILATYMAARGATAVDPVETMRVG